MELGLLTFNEASDWRILKICINPPPKSKIKTLMYRFQRFTFTHTLSLAHTHTLIGPHTLSHWPTHTHTLSHWLTHPDVLWMFPLCYPDHPQELVDVIARVANHTTEDDEDVVYIQAPHNLVRCTLIGRHGFNQRGEEREEEWGGEERGERRGMGRGERRGKRRRETV